MARDLDHGTIDTVMPAHDAALMLARVQVSAVGNLLDLGVDEIDDLRLATEELCVLVLTDPGRPNGRLHLTFHWDELTIQVASVIDPDGAASAKLPEDARPPSTLSLQILAALTDEYDLEDVAGVRRAWFRKKRRST